MGRLVHLSFQITVNRTLGLQAGLNEYRLRKFDLKLMPVKYPNRSGQGFSLHKDLIKMLGNLILCFGFFPTTVPQSCSDDTRCVVYPEDRCGEQWLQTNCRLKCKLCSK